MWTECGDDEVELVEPTATNDRECRPARKFYVTSVADNLDPTDGQLFVDGYSALGYDFVGWNRDVSTAELVDYLSQPLNLLYHTGHGDVGSVATSDGVLRTWNVEAIEVRHTIFATCLTLADADWKNRFGSSAQNIMGYTKYSYDHPVDDRVVKLFTSYLGQGYSHLVAWYKSNSREPKLSDRWAAYSREGEQIVEYSAFSGTLPPLKSVVGEPVALFNNLTVDVGIVEAPQVFEGSLPSAALESLDASQQLDNQSFLWPSERTDLSAEEASAFAWEALEMLGDVPEQAVLDDVSPIARCEHDTLCEVVGYQVRFAHEHEGLLIRGNLAADFVTVLVANQGALSIDVDWSLISASAEPAPTAFMDSSSALVSAAESIDRFIRGQAVHIASVEPVHGVRTNELGARTLVPAYEFVSDGGERFVVDAVRGELMF